MVRNGRPDRALRELLRLISSLAHWTPTMSRVNWTCMHTWVRMQAVVVFLWLAMRPSMHFALPASHCLPTHLHRWLQQTIQETHVAQVAHMTTLVLPTTATATTAAQD